MHFAEVDCVSSHSATCNELSTCLLFTTLVLQKQAQMNSDRVAKNSSIVTQLSCDTVASPAALHSMCHAAVFGHWYSM